MPEIERWMQHLNAFLRVCLAVVVLSLTLHVGWVRADVVDRGNVQISWNAPDGCPQVQAVLERVEKLLGAPLSESATGAIRFEGAVSVEGATHRLWLQSQQASHGGSRILISESCEEVTQAGALVIALSIDPSVAARQAGIGVAVRQPASGAASAQADAGAIERSPSATAIERQPRATERGPAPPLTERGPAPPLTERGPAPPLTERGPAPRATARGPAPPATQVVPGESLGPTGADALSSHSPRPSQDNHGGWTLGASAGIVADGGTLPRLTLGPEVKVGLRSSWLELKVAALWLPGVRRDVAEGKGGVVSFFGTAVLGCVVHHGVSKRWAVASCAGPELGILHAVGKGTASEGAGSPLWAAGSMEFSGQWCANERLSLEATFAPVFPIPRPKFTLTNVPNGLVHQPGVVALRFGLVGRLSF